MPDTAFSLPESPRPVRRSRQGGFTLLELLVAISILALMSVLGWRGLETVIVARERLGAAADELRSLSVAFAQLDEDLRRSWPVRLLDVGTPALQWVADPQAGWVDLELIRESSQGREPTRIQRVVWRVRGEVLERGFGPWVTPQSLAPTGAGTAGPSEPAGASELVWQPVLAQVRGVQWQVWQFGRGWSAAGSSVPAQSDGAIPVTGVEVQVQKLDGHAYVRVFPVRD